MKFGTNNAQDLKTEKVSCHNQKLSLLIQVDSSNQFYRSKQSFGATALTSACLNKQSLLVSSARVIMKYMTVMTICLRVTMIALG